MIALLLLLTSCAVESSYVWEFTSPRNGSTHHNCLIPLQMSPTNQLNFDNSSIEADQVCLQSLAIGSNENYEKACFAFTDYQWRHTILDAAANSNSWIGVEASGWSKSTILWRSATMFLYSPRGPPPGTTTATTTTTTTTTSNNEESTREPAADMIAKETDTFNDQWSTTDDMRWMNDTLGLLEILLPLDRSSGHHGKSLRLKVETNNDVRKLLMKSGKICTTLSSLNTGSSKNVCYKGDALQEWKYDDVVDTNGITGKFMFRVEGYVIEGDEPVIERTVMFEVDVE